MRAETDCKEEDVFLEKKRQHMTLYNIFVSVIRVCIVHKRLRILSEWNLFYYATYLSMILMHETIAVSYIKAHFLYKTILYSNELLSNKWIKLAN